MAVRMRLTRVGSKKNPIYRVVVADSRSPRDGKIIEIVGRYNPQTDPSTIDFDEEKVKEWLSKGATPIEHGLAVAEEGRTSVAELLATSRGSSSTTRTRSRSRGRSRRGPTVLQLRVAKDDVGKVIGRQGRIARALPRSCARAGRVRTSRVVLEILE